MPQLKLSEAANFLNSLLGGKLSWRNDIKHPSSSKWINLGQPMNKIKTKFFIVIFWFFCFMDLWRKKWTYIFISENHDAWPLVLMSYTIFFFYILLALVFPSSKRFLWCLIYDACLIFWCVFSFSSSERFWYLSQSSSWSFSLFF